jgi:hypothetical protein
MTETIAARTLPKMPEQGTSQPINSTVAQVHSNASIEVGGLPEPAGFRRKSGNAAIPARPFRN